MDQWTDKITINESHSTQFTTLWKVAFLVLNPRFYGIQACKLAAARVGTFVEYKIRKAQSGPIQRMRKEEGMPEAFS